MEVSLTLQLPLPNKLQSNRQVLFVDDVAGLINSDHRFALTLRAEPDGQRTLAMHFDTFSLDHWLLQHWADPGQRPQIGSKALQSLELCLTKPVSRLNHESGRYQLTQEHVSVLTGQAITIDETKDAPLMLPRLADILVKDPLSQQQQQSSSQEVTQITNIGAMPTNQGAPPVLLPDEPEEDNNEEQDQTDENNPNDNDDLLISDSHTAADAYVAAMLGFVPRTEDVIEVDRQTDTLTLKREVIWEEIGESANNDQMASVVSPPLMMTEQHSDTVVETETEEITTTVRKVVEYQTESSASQLSSLSDTNWIYPDSRPRNPLPRDPGFQRDWDVDEDADYFYTRRRQRRRLMPTDYDPPQPNDDDERCFVASPFDIDACLLKCENLNETEWTIQLQTVRFIPELGVTAYNYRANTTGEPGICTHESLSQRLTAVHLMFDGCCMLKDSDNVESERDADYYSSDAGSGSGSGSGIEELTAGVHSELEWDFLRGGWVFHMDVTPRHSREFTLYVSDDVPPTLGSACVRGAEVRCACQPLGVPDLCYARENGGDRAVTSGMLDTVDKPSNHTANEHGRKY